MLAVTTAARSEVLPDIPTVGEFVPGYEASAFFGLGAPKETPVEIIDKLNREINAALSDPRIRARLAEVGGTVLAGTPAEFSKLIADETEKWGKVIRAANIKAEYSATGATEIPYCPFREVGDKDRCWHFSAVPTAPSDVRSQG